MPENYLTTKEAARYLGIHEKQVYALLKERKLPGSRITGKWLFPKKLLDRLIEEDAGGFKDAKRRSSRHGGVLLAAGSNDPILELIFSLLHGAHPDIYLFSANIGSTQGLNALGAEHADIALCHLWDPHSNDYNVPFIKKHLPRLKAVVVNLFRRDLGLITAAGNPFGIAGIKDLRRRGLRFINRQAGAGTRILLDHHLRKAEIAPLRINGYDREVSTHYEVGLAVLSGEADVGLASGSVADLLKLDFIPLTKERFDMVLAQATFFSRPFQAVLSFIGSEELRRRLAGLGRYDTNDSGRVVYAAMPMAS